jgi:hypothetical protein
MEHQEPTFQLKRLQNSLLGLLSTKEDTRMSFNGKLFVEISQTVSLTESEHVDRVPKVQIRNPDRTWPVTFHTTYPTPLITSTRTTKRH